MRLLDRYLLRELIVPLTYCLGGFLIFWVTYDLFTEISNFQRNHLRAGDIAEYYFVKAPEMLVIVIPLALLLALLYALTNHARHHELTAIRAAGINLWRLALPYFGVALAAGLALFLLNELAVPDGAEKADQIFLRRAGALTNVTPRCHCRPSARAGTGARRLTIRSALSAPSGTARSLSRNSASPATAATPKYGTASRHKVVPAARMAVSSW